MQPGCTIEVLRVPANDFHQLGGLGPSNLLQLVPYMARQVLMDRHQVVSLATGLREAVLQIIVKRIELLQSPVLVRAHFTQISSEFDEPGVTLAIHLPLPS